MSAAQVVFLVSAALGTVGLGLLLPRGSARGWMLGAGAATVALGLLISQVPPWGGWMTAGVFHLVAGVTVLGAVGTLCAHSPVYAAVWFGLSLVGTAGLFLIHGAQFLAAATLVVYAGAILVTFLFVLMLAQPEGRSTYDRVGWEPVVSAATGSVLAVVLALSVTATLGRVEGESREAISPNQPRAEGVLSEDHVARIGRELFGRHLGAVEVGGVLLLAALVGAAAMMARAGSEPGVRPFPPEGISRRSSRE